MRFNKKISKRQILINFTLLLIMLVTSSCSTLTVDNSLSTKVENGLTHVSINIAKDSTETSSNISLTVNADSQDSGMIAYQWYISTSENLDGTLIENATSNTYSVNTTNLDKKYYYCIMTYENSNSGIIHISKYRTRTVCVDSTLPNNCTTSINTLRRNQIFPSIKTTSDLINISSYNTYKNSGDSIELTCFADIEGDKNLSYQWYENSEKVNANGTAITGANNNVYSTEYFKELGINYYYCVVTNTTENNKGITKETSTTSPIFSVAYTGLPTLYIDTNNSKITKKDYVKNCNFKLIDKEFGEVEYDELKIKGRGNSTWGRPKSSYSLKLNKKKSLLGMAKDKKWVIVANYMDKSLIRNSFVSSIGNSFFDNMEWNPSFKSVDLILDGKYFGTYILGEKVKIADCRVNIQDMSDIKDDVNNDGLVDINDGGFIVEVNERMDEDYNFRTTNNVAISLSDPDDKEDVSKDMFNYVKTIVQKAEDVLYSANFKDQENGYSKYIDVDSVIDWYLVNEFTKNIDAAFFSSVYMYYNPVDQKIYMGPNWDFDLSCGNTDYNNCDDYEGFHIKNSKWISRMFEDPAFVAKVQDRWIELQNDLKSSINEGIDNEVSKIEVSANCNFLKWPELGAYIFHNDPGYADRKTYQSEIDYLETWLNNRYDWMDENLLKL